MNTHVPPFIHTVLYRHIFKPLHPDVGIDVVEFTPISVEGVFIEPDDEEADGDDVDSDGIDSDDDIGDDEDGGDDDDVNTDGDTVDDVIS